jgi:hypothetical protein
MNADYDNAHWFSLDQAAEVLGSTPLNVLMYIKRGLLTALEHDGDWRVDPDSLAMLIRKRGEGNAPAVCRSACAKQAGGCGSCA